MKKIIPILIFLLTFYGCKKETENKVHERLAITTSPITNITARSATGGGIITNDGDGVIKLQGICYSTSPNPTIEDNTTNNGTDSGQFISNLIVTENRTYYVRAFAINDYQIVYGSEVEFTTPTDNSGTMPIETIWVAGGNFEMGSPNNVGNNDEHPLHSVTLNGFHISKYEITNQQFSDFLNSVGANSNAVINGICYMDLANSSSEIIYQNNAFTPISGKENYPVRKVSWFGAEAFSNYYGGRLPTEAEWEFAAKGGNNSNNYKYAGSDNIDEVAWYTGNIGNISPKSRTVGTKNPNELGIYDMTGNVCEWCNDWYNGNYYNNSPANSPQGPTNGTNRVTRGGAFNFQAIYDRVACRDEGDYGPSTTFHYLGFRAVFP